VPRDIKQVKVVQKQYTVPMYSQNNKQEHVSLKNTKYRKKP